LILDRRFSVVALLGAPNSGKSTLINRVVGTKVSIVSPKIQTTRNRVLGILIKDSTQIVFVDTPGIFEPKRRLQRAMVHSAWGSAHDADQVVFVLDSTVGITDTTRQSFEIFEAKNIRVTLALNKIDLVHPSRLLELADFFSSKKICSHIFMVSALTGDGIVDLVTSVLGSAGNGNWLYPEDQVSDLPPRNLAAEITRESLFLQLQQELPYSCTVETDSWQVLKDNSIRIEQTIYVKRSSHKLIVVGRKGSKIKSVGTAARGKIERVLGEKVHLFIQVKIDKDWGERPEFFRSLGLKYDV
jgi:GTP-binding protein Era